LLLTIETTAPPYGAREVSVALADTAFPPATVVADKVKSASAIPMLSSRTVSSASGMTLSAVAFAVCENGPTPVTRTVTQTSSSNAKATPILGIWQVTVFAVNSQLPNS
jgi:hypothetical protein